LGRHAPSPASSPIGGVLCATAARPSRASAAGPPRPPPEHRLLHSAALLAPRVVQVVGVHHAHLQRQRGQRVGGGVGGAAAAAPWAGCSQEARQRAAALHRLALLHSPKAACSKHPPGQRGPAGGRAGAAAPPPQQASKPCFPAGTSDQAAAAAKQADAVTFNISGSWWPLLLSTVVRTTWLNLSVQRLPWWYQLRCSGSSSTATSASLSGMYCVMSPTGRMEPGGGGKGAVRELQGTWRRAASACWQAAGRRPQGRSAQWRRDTPMLPPPPPCVARAPPCPRPCCRPLGRPAGVAGAAHPSLLRSGLGRTPP
jgi:hypothetical protein